MILAALSREMEQSERTIMATSVLRYHNNTPHTFQAFDRSQCPVIKCCHRLLSDEALGSSKGLIRGRGGGFIRCICGLVGSRRGRDGQLANGQKHEILPQHFSDDSQWYNTRSSLAPNSAWTIQLAIPKSRSTSSQETSKSGCCPNKLKLYSLMTDLRLNIPCISHYKI